MSDNLLERLETLGRGLGRQFIIYNEAAEEITRLRAENEKLREALRPFAEEADCYSEDVLDCFPIGHTTTVKHLRVALNSLDG